MIKTGAQHIEMLKDGRQVYINGQSAGDVTAHPAFRRTIQSIGALYDFQARPENRELMTFEVPEGGGQRANRIWQLPRSHADLVERRKALEAWTELHCGFLGRAPDHVASCISGMFMGIEVFEAYDKQPRRRTCRLLPLRQGQRTLSHLRHHQSAGRPFEVRKRATRSASSPPASSIRTQQA